MLRARASTPSTTASSRASPSYRSWASGGLRSTRPRSSRPAPARWTRWSTRSARSTARSARLSDSAGARSIVTPQPESAYAWTRLFAALALSAIGGVGMWSVIVALPAVQAEFGVARAAASLPYTVTMVSFGVGGIIMGRLSDRFGIIVPVIGGAVGLGIGYAAASQATSVSQFILAQGVLVGVAGSIAFAPLIADTSLWFTRRRGIAVAVISSGSYVAGTVWPPVVQHFIERDGWRRTYLCIAV